MDSVGGLLYLLQEPTLQSSTLSTLHTLVPTHWSEILHNITAIEDLAASATTPTPTRQLAASLVSRCYYHLDELDFALHYALQAGPHLDIASPGEFEAAIIGRCIDVFVKLSSPESAEKEELVDLFGDGAQLEAIVDELLRGSVARGALREAVGIALEARRVEKVVKVLLQAADHARQPEMLTYVLAALKGVKGPFRLEVLDALVTLHEGRGEDEVNYLELLTCLYELRDAQRFAAQLQTLLARGKPLVAYQAALDVVATQDSKFVSAVANRLTEPLAEKGPQSNRLTGTLAENDQAKRLTDILAGDVTRVVHAAFLKEHNASDDGDFKRLKKALTQGRGAGSVLRHAALVCHGLLKAATSDDAWLKSKDGKDFAKPANNWARFSAVATYGVVHRGHLAKAKEAMEAFRSGGSFVEGGALYALGLSGVKDDAKYMECLATDGLGEESKVVPLQHGAALALGLSSISNPSADKVQALLTLINQDDAVASSAAAYSLGMLLLGHGDAQVASLLDIALDQTKHEKIIRAIGISIALMLYNTKQAAEKWIALLEAQSDALLRYGGMYAMGLAYLGTSDAGVLRRLLRVAVSDVSNDVRRAAVTNLGLVCLDKPEALPELLELLAESYNPFVRYGAAMALGVASCTTAAAKDILSRLQEDKVDFVRQAALMAGAMVNQQRNSDVDAKARRFKEAVYKVVGTDKTSVMARMGGVLAAGILDAAGRNASISILGRSEAVVGMVLFLQYWYWYPLMHTLCLCFAPSVLVGVDGEMRMVRSWKVECDYSNMKVFEYPSKYVEKKTEAKVKVQTAVLSMTAKANKKTKDATTGERGAAAAAMEVEEEEKKEESKVMELTEERREEMLTNPIRVTRAMKRYVQWVEGQRCMPVARDEGHKSGIVVLEDTTPNAGELDVREYEFTERQPAQPQQASGEQQAGDVAAVNEIPDSFTFRPQI